MMQYLKAIGAVGIVLLNVHTWGGVLFPQTGFGGEQEHVVRPLPRGPGERRHTNARPAMSTQQIVRVVLLAWAAPAVLLFIVDSFRRNYVMRKTLPVALALFGLLSFGITSLIYYLVWGLGPVVPADQFYRTTFCDQCVASSTDQGAGNTTLINLVIGSCLLGNADRCDTCGSTIKTLWALAVIPLAPFGSYRVQPTAQGQYISRRVPLHWRQVLLTYCIGLAVAGPFLYWLISGAWKGETSQ
jgi:hypothetical protein